jgi:hypothetical protein
MVVKYVMEVIMSFRSWSMWMLTWHTVNLHHIVTVYNDMFDHTDGAMGVLAKQMTEWKEDLSFTVKGT